MNEFQDWGYKVYAINQIDSYNQALIVGCQGLGGNLTGLWQLQSCLEYGILFLELVFGYLKYIVYI